jgi:hypothetical protein
VLPVLGDEGHSAERRAGIGRGVRVAEDDVLELDPSDGTGRLGHGDRAGASWIAGTSRGTRRCGRTAPGRLQIERDAHEPHERHEQARLHGREGDDGAGGDRPVPPAMR